MNASCFCRAILASLICCYRWALIKHTKVTSKCCRLRYDYSCCFLVCGSSAVSFFSLSSLDISTHFLFPFLLFSSLSFFFIFFLSFLVPLPFPPFFLGNLDLVRAAFSRMFRFEWAVTPLCSGRCRKRVPQNSGSEIEATIFRLFVSEQDSKEDPV